MPSPQSQITQFYNLLRATAALNGVKFLLGARHLADQGAPPRIVMFPVEGPVDTALNNVTAIRDVARLFAVRCWGKDFDEACDLEQRFCQGLVEQAKLDVSYFWKTQSETWNTDPDTSRQGEEVELLVAVPQSIDYVALTLGQIDEVAPRRTTALAAALSAVATSATVVSTGDYPASGVLHIDDEQLSYTGKTATTFTGLTRGIHGTTAASHASAAVIEISAT